MFKVYAMIVLILISNIIRYWND